MQISNGFLEWLPYMPLHFAALPKIKQGHFCKVMDVCRETGSSILYSHLGNSLQS